MDLTMNHLQKVPFEGNDTSWMESNNGSAAAKSRKHKKTARLYQALLEAIQVIIDPL